MKINILNLPVFYINLDKDAKKNQETLHRLEQAGFTNINRFPGILGETKKLGCALSHRALLSELEIDGPFIVFEDDIHLSDSFDPVIEIPDDADAYYLGLSKFALNAGVTSNDLLVEKIDYTNYRIYNMLAAHAILYLNKGYYKFLSKAITAMIKDNRNQDNARAETMKFFNIYAPNKPLFYQGGKHEEVTNFNIDTEEDISVKGGIVNQKVTVVILTWQRLKALQYTLSSLAGQTYRDFDIIISNANPKEKRFVDRLAEKYRDRLSITVHHDGNDWMAFRRLFSGRQAAESGSDIVMYLDDDVQIPANYVEHCLRQYRPKKYFSNFAWSFQKHGKDYYKYRTRHWNNDQKLHYGGTGISMIDASVFLDDRLFTVPIGAFTVEDLWLSYFVDHILSWDIQYMSAPGVVLGGADAVALYRQVSQEVYDKADLLRYLVSLGWKI
jgi:hypothetical protein